MRELVLHAMVVVLFFEGLTYGPVSVGRVMALIALFGAALVVASDPRARLLPHPAVAVPATLFAVWSFTSLAWAEATGWADAMLQLVLALCYFAGYTVLIESREQVRRMMITFVVCATSTTAVGFAQSVNGQRAVGLQGDANTYALYCLAALPIAATLALSGRILTRYTWVICAALLLAAVLASQSRGAVLATAAMVLFLLARGSFGGTLDRNRPWWLLFGATTIGAGVFIIARTIPRFAPQEVGAGTGRLDIWRSAFGAWQEHPLLGIGAGVFQTRSGQLLSQTPGVQLDPYSVLFEGIKIHNSYLEPLVELGPVGLLTYAGILVGTWALLSRDRRPGSDVIGALHPMLAGFVVASIFLSATNNKLLWLLVGIAGILPYLPETRTSASLPPPGALVPALQKEDS